MRSSQNTHCFWSNKNYSWFFFLMTLFFIIFHFGIFVKNLIFVLKLMICLWNILSRVTLRESACTCVFTCFQTTTDCRSAAATLHTLRTLSLAPVKWLYTCVATELYQNNRPYTLYALYGFVVYAFLYGYSITEISFF